MHAFAARFINTARFLHQFPLAYVHSIAHGDRSKFFLHRDFWRGNVKFVAAVILNFFIIVV